MRSRHPRAVLLIAVLLLCPGCADTSYAPPPTPELEVLRIVLLLVALGVLALWVMFLLAIWQREGAMDRLVGVFPTILLTIAMFTWIGQQTDSVTTAVLSWGVPGSILMVLAGAVAGLNGAGGSPWPWIVLWGFLYPRLDTFLLIVVPSLITQIAMLVITFNRVRT